MKAKVKHKKILNSEVKIMSFYSKISLLALLAAGTVIGMEQPPLLREGFAGQAPQLKHPAQSPAAQTINQPMIEITYNGSPINKVQKNYLEASVTLKNLLGETGAQNSLEVPESMVDDYQEIKDLLSFEHRLQSEIVNQNTIINLLKQKTKQQLVAILNGCQRFELNKISECAVTVLAEKLSTSARKEECLKNGTYNLNWTGDVARLVAQQMIKNTNHAMAIIYWLAQATLNKNGKIRFQDFKIDGNVAQYSFTDLMDYFPSPAVAYIGPVSIVKTPRRSIFENMYSVPFIALPQDAQQNIQLQLLHAYGIEVHDRTILPRLKYSVVQPFLANSSIPIPANIPIDHLGFYYLHAADLENHINTKLIPEELILMEYCYNRKKEEKEYNFIAYPGLQKLKNSLSQELKTLIFPSWWQRRNWYTKAALIAGGAALTGWVAWQRYKYFSQK